MITTSRLILRQWTDEDAPAFAAMNADPQVMEHFSSMWTRETSDAVMQKLWSFIDDKGWGSWAGETGSEAVMQRLGMIKVAGTFEHPAVTEGHRLREHVLYRMVKGSRPSR